MSTNLEQAFLERDEYIGHKELFNGFKYYFRTGTDRKVIVVRHKFSYGNENGLYELADITNGNVDVEGCLTVDNVIEILEEER